MTRSPRVLVSAAGDRSPLPTLEAARRAGAGGILDLAGRGAGELAEALPIIRRVADRWGATVAVRVDAGAPTDAWIAALPATVGPIIAVASTLEGTEAAAAVARLAEAGRVAWAEVATRGAAARAEVAGAAALVTAGHEAGGLVGDDSSFILLQAVVATARVPVFVRGGVGPRVAAGCVAAGAAGVVLDGLTLLTGESPLAPSDRARVARWDGGETRLFGPSGGLRLRLHVAPGSPLVDQLAVRDGETSPAWLARVGPLVGFAPGRAWPVGQDSALAATLGDSGATVAEVVGVVNRAIDEATRPGVATRPLAEGSPLARALGTRFPILQGPMTRVSDVPEFSRAVADGGALPFLALALLRGPEVAATLARAHELLADRPWGVGLLGFVDPDLRREQVAAVRAARPPFALIAGGRPDQARELDDAGIATFLHVPSPGLMDRFLRDGARRFVLEGRECGGHVGPRSSFVLWEQALAAVGRAVAGGIPASDIQLVFAGGIHDGRSARFVATLAAPAARLGVKVGVLVGTAYLFTREAVATGAIVERYQAEAVRCAATVLLETGPGHEVRVGPSPFVAAFEAERARLHADEADPDRARSALERLNAGRLRVASKGVDRLDGAGSPLVAVPPAEQFDRGIYMWGQVATLRHEVGTIAELHRSIADGQAGPEIAPAPPEPRPCDIAIVGMAAILPGAGDVRTFWENTLAGRDSIVEIPPDRWDWRLYYDADPKAPDKVVSKWGGFVPDVPFDPLRYGMPPASLPSIEPVQLLLLEAARAAIQDAGYTDRPFARERTAVVLGMGGGAAQLAMGYAFRSYLPMLDAVAPGSGRATLDACRGLLPEWTEDSFPGFLLNVAAGRVANRFDLGGANYTVDAACGSSLAAANLAVRELESGAADVVLLGGADTVQNPFTYLAFSKTHAFSPRGRCRPFDASADGIVISEGVAMVVLKRLADAERDGDRIYSVIRGLGASSDGRARGLTAPSPDGQVRAVSRALERSGIDPRTIGYVEAHGTGTAVGDVVEVNAISGVYRDRGVAPGSVALGSVKSTIGHTKCAAGLAGLINASLALHHRVLPPTIGVDALNPKADLRDGPFRVNTTPRPWLHDRPDRPRRAGVSAFGFGGTNFHAVLEAYDGNPGPAQAPTRDWPAELLVWRAVDRAGLGASLARLSDRLRAGARPILRDLARAVNLAHPAPGSGEPVGPTLAIVAESLLDLGAKLDAACAALDEGRDRLDDPRGVFFAARPEFAGRRVAFLFPGQGSQRPGMLVDLALAFPEVRAAFEGVDDALLAAGRPGVGPFVFPPPGRDEADRDRATRDLAATDRAQPALVAASLGLLRLLGSLGIEADVVAGHSFGELVALHAAGALDAGALARLADERGRLMADAIADRPGAMAAVAAGSDLVGPLLASFGAVTVANENGPDQTTIAGPEAQLQQAVASIRAAALAVRELPVAGAFHTALVAAVREPLARAARREVTSAPDRPAYSNLDARPHPADPASIADRVGEHAVRPVRFGATVGAMHDDGARVFVEVGPGSVLTGLVGSILTGRPHVAVALDSARRGGIPTLLLALARLAVAGVPVRLDRLSEGRSDRRLDLGNLPVGDGSPPLPASTWLVNGSRSRPRDAPEPKRLGQGAELLGPPRSLAIPGPGPTLAPPAAPSNGPHGNGQRSPMNHGNGTPGGNGNGHHHAPELAGNGRAATPPPTPAPRGNPADERVLASFQETMRLFLDVQRSTMLAYLNGRAAATAATAAPIAPILAPPVLPPALGDRLHARSITPAPPVEVRPEPVAPAVVAAPVPVIVAAPAPVAPPVPTPVAPAGAEPLAREAVATRLVEIVRDRTGYPSEMLGLDLDMEADLGIDSIKRVEILGTLRDSVPALGATSDGSIMDALARARTLGAIADRVVDIQRRAATPVASRATAARPGAGREARSAGSAGGSPAGGDADADPEPAPGASGVRRLLIEAVPAPLDPARERPLPRGGVVVVTDDGRGVARALATRFEAGGHPVVLIRPDAFDLGSPASVDLALAQARSRGPLAAIIHALPLRRTADAGLDPARWAARLTPEVRGLFLLAQGAAPDLARAAGRGGAALIAATGMGGAFASAGSVPGDLFAGHGGVAGLVKTLAREWPGVRTRVVDLDPGEEPGVLADRLAAEALSRDGWSEVGYRAGGRLRLRAGAEPLDRRGAARISLQPGEPVVLTGGARGITAASALEMARRWQPTLLLIGRSPLPPDLEDPATAALTAAGPLKAALLARLKWGGGPVTPSELERAYQATLQGREIRANLAAIRATGATVDYARADVRDAAALGTVLDGWRTRFGPPVGLVHGAGMIQDKLIRDKTLASWDAVVGTKVEGALNLARLIDPASLRFAAFFSSIAGRFGNAGQSDYAAANDILNKLAVDLDRRWAARVVAVNWGPWSGVGMVADLEGHLGARGLGMIPPEVGRSLLVDELQFGAKGRVEIVVAGDLGTLDAPIEPEPPTTPLEADRPARAPDLAGAAR